MNKQANNIVRKWSGPAVSVISYGLIIGFALSGLGIMGISAMVWVIFSTSLFSGFGLLTGGLFLSAAMALFLGKLAKTGDTLYQHREESEPSQA